MRAIDLRWTKNLKEPELKKNFEIALRNSTFVNSRIVEVLREIRSENSKTKFSDYDSASWAFKQADQNGYLRAIDDVLSLFNYLEIK